MSADAYGSTHPIESEGTQGGGEWVWGEPAADPPNVLSFRLGLSYHVDAGMNIDIEGQPVTYEEWQSVRYWWDRLGPKGTR